MIFSPPPDVGIPGAEVHWLKVRYLDVDRLFFVVISDSDATESVLDELAARRSDASPEERQPELLTGLTLAHRSGVGAQGSADTTAGC